MKIVRSFHFEASHSLPCHDGACRNLHGHSYRLELVLAGAIRPVQAQDPQSGFVVDFGRLQEVVQRQLIDPYLDHRHLNDSLPGLIYPSAEHLVLWIFRWCLEHLEGLPEMGGAVVHSLRMWETERSRVEVERDEVLAFFAAAS